MARKQKSGKTLKGILETVAAPERLDELHQNAQLLSLLTALLDREGVIERDGTTYLPNGLFVAERLLQKVNSYLRGTISGSDLPSNERQWRRMNYLWKQGDQLVEWGLLESWKDDQGVDRVRYPSPDRRITFEDAVLQPWCTYKTVSNLKRFLERVSFPIEALQRQLQPRWQPYLTQSAYNKAAEADLERQDQLDRQRKQRRRSEMTTGKKTPKSRTKRPTSGM
jgi:hypothetical protein